LLQLISFGCEPLKKILVVLGPTASGKSDLAVKLALERNGEVISADSRQVYRGLDIGSGKITSDEMKGVPHHLLDVTSPHKIFTVSDYARLARRAAEDILSEASCHRLRRHRLLYRRYIIRRFVRQHHPRSSHPQTAPKAINRRTGGQGFRSWTRTASPR
jgi:predicted Ser/Thr protein kinase